MELALAPSSPPVSLSDYHAEKFLAKLLVVAEASGQAGAPIARATAVLANFLMDLQRANGITLFALIQRLITCLSLLIDGEQSQLSN